VSKPFFLTRQTANLMEDFARELKVGASIFLLYGDNGAGKTRLLRELSENRLSSARIHWIDLNATSGDEKNQQFSSAEVEAVFDAANSGDIIVVDHFESALKKTRHQLFVSWSSDGVDKKLNMVVASSSEGFNEFRQLSQHYQVNVHSFELEPFNPDEVEAFLGFYLFPDHPIGKLSIPSDLRKQLVATHGAVGPVIKIAERDGAQIGSSPMTDTESIRKGSRTMVTILILFAITAGVGWYFLSSRSTPLDTVPAVAGEAEPVATYEPAVEVEVQKEVEAEAEAETVAKVEPATSSLTEDELEVEPGSAAAEPEPVVTEPEPVVSAAVETTAEVEAMPEAAPDTQTQMGPEPGTASDTDAVLVEEASQEDTGDTALASVEISPTQPQQAVLTDKARFQQDLRFSMDWIETKEDSAGTIQILLLSFSGFDPTAYYEYLQYLSSQQVDIDNIRVFKTLTGGTEVYSVVYGEYASRSAAGKSLAGLPEALRNISPIRRSVGGIRQEIRRLGP
jgi:septal ring-binding cell division protein DamX